MPWVSGVRWSVLHGRPGRSEGQRSVRASAAVTVARVSRVRLPSALGLRRARWQPRHADAAIALVLTVGAAVPGVSAQGIALAELPVRSVDALGILLVLGQALPVALGRRWPGVVLVVVGAAFAVDQAMAYPTTFASLGVLVALFIAGGRLGAHRPVALAATAAVYVGLAVALHHRGSPERTTEFASFGVVLAACWAAGAWSRARRVRARVQERELAADAVARERARIARELHDVVTHHVTAMVVQADAARFTIGAANEGTALPDALTSIADSGRHALVELRHQLGVLGSQEADAGRELEAHDIDALVRRSVAAGQSVHLEQVGEPQPASTVARLAAYRVVQEALTNAMKHAPGARIDIHLEHTGDAVEVRVVSAPAAGVPAGASAPGSGRGLTGLRERLSLLGGEVEAGRRPDGAFGVVARIPNEPTP